MVKIWMKKKKVDFVAGEWCPVCGNTENNVSPFPFTMCMGKSGNDHKPIAMIRVHQKKGYFPRPQKRSIFR